MKSDNSAPPDSSHSSRGIHLLPKLSTGKVTWLAVGLQLVLASGALALGFWERLPWLGIVGVSLAIVLAATLARKGAAAGSDLLLWWGGGLLFPASVLFFPTRSPVGDLPCAGFLVLLGASGLLVSLRLADPSTRAKWRATGLGWAFLGLLLALALGYTQNLKLVFYLATLLSLALVSFCKIVYRLPTWVIQGLNTLILLAVGLLVVGLVQKDPETADLGPTTRQVFRFEDARKDPAGFRRSWIYYRRQWASMLPKLFEMYRESPLFYRPRPDTHAMFWYSQVKMNHLGFRGKELAQPKGNTYRIVALGESTTFGVTLNPGEQPWPELLEQMIRERLHPSRPVEVVNAGIPSYSLTNNLLRLQATILPLQADLLVSYHGYNGFPMLYSAAGAERTPSPPAYQPRPIPLLADTEYHARLLWYRHLRGAQRLDPSAASRAMQTDYARAYRTLMTFARTNQMHLALATYSMAVNRQSEAEVVAFYQTCFPDTPIAIEANEVHSQLVLQLCAENPDVIFIDSRPGLDGHHDLFLDLMHFTPAGEHRLAETIFQTLRPVLERDLAPQAEAGRN